MMKTNDYHALLHEVSINKAFENSSGGNHISEGNISLMKFMECSFPTSALVAGTYLTNQKSSEVGLKDGSRVFRSYLDS